MCRSKPQVFEMNMAENMKFGKVSMNATVQT